jgi:hypothetical protein
VLSDHDAQLLCSIELSDCRSPSPISSMTGARLRIIFQTSFVAINVAVCVLRLRVAENYIAMQQAITPRADRLKRKRSPPLIW